MCLSVLKIKSVIFVWALRIFTISGCLFVERSKNKVSARFYRKSPTNSEIHSVTLFRKLVSAFRSPLWLQRVFRKPPVILKIVPKAAYDSEHFSVSRPRHVHWRKSRTIFRISVFKEAGRNFFIFYFSQCSLKISKQFTHILEVLTYLNRTSK
jgi:hypothetical protein